MATIQQDIARIKQQQKKTSLERVRRLAKEQGKEDIVKRTTSQIKAMEPKAGDRISYKTASGGTQEGRIEVIGGKQYVISVGQPGTLEQPLKTTRTRTRTIDVKPSLAASPKVTGKDALEPTTKITGKVTDRISDTEKLFSEEKLYTPAPESSRFFTSPLQKYYYGSLDE